MSLNTLTESLVKDFLKGEKGQIYLADLFGLHAGTKVFNKYSINSLIECAIESFIIINN